jgi:hypothetical protein
VTGCAIAASAIAQHRDNQHSNDPPDRRERWRSGLVAFSSQCKRGFRMWLHFVVLAILLLTLMATYAIRRAEEEMVERHDP